MRSILVFLALMGLAAANPLYVLGRGVARLHDDGQWKPAFDGSWLGAGHLSWLGHDDGQWKPALDNSAAGLPLHRLYRRAVLVNPHALPTPVDAPHVALAKQAQLVQQHTEGVRNVLGGGVPVHLPADTPEVALGKQAHAVAHAHQKALTAGVPLVSAVHTPLAYSGYHHPLAYHGLQGLVF